jgi:hypothetical protein
MGLIKVFSGSEILAIGLQERLEEASIKTVVKNNIQSGRMAGFGTIDQAVEVFIEEVNYGKAHAILEKYRLEI